MRKYWRKLKSRDRSAHPYLIINLLFGAFILLVFLYAWVFPPEPGSHPLPCIYTLATGEPCASCGLSRALSHIVRGDFSQAVITNTHSMRIFLFFVVQLFMRTAVSVICIKNILSIQKLATADAVFSAALFLYSFAPFLL